MRERRRPGQHPERSEGSPEPPLPPTLVLGLHPATGNARISRMLAEELLETEIAPHPPEDASEDARTLAAGPGGLAGAFGGLEEIHADSPAGAPLDPLEEWLRQQPASNADMAAWLLAGEQHGFVHFRPLYRRQMADIRDGKPDLGVITDIDRTDKNDPKPVTGRMKLKTTGAPLGALTVLTGLARARAERWVADPTQPKAPVDAGDIIRNLAGGDAHSGGASADLFPQFDWDGAGGPAQVIQALQDLPKGSYTIGLPMQGQFFPKDQYLATRQAKSIADAGTGGKPKDIVDPSLVYWTAVTYTSRYDAGRGKYPWQDAPAGRGVLERLRSAPLKDAIRALAGQGTTIDVMPDYDNHLHVTRN